MQIPGQYRINIFQSHSGRRAPSHWRWLFAQASRRRPGIGTGRRITEQPSFASDHERANRILAAVVVDGQITSLSVACEATPVFQQVRSAVPSALWG